MVNELFEDRHQFWDTPYDIAKSDDVLLRPAAAGGGPGVGPSPGGGRPAADACGIWGQRLLRAVAVSDWLSGRSADVEARGLKPAARRDRHLPAVRWRSHAELLLVLREPEAKKNGLNGRKELCFHR